MSSMNRSSGGAGTRPTYSMDSVWPTRVQFAREAAGPESGPSVSFAQPGSAERLAVHLGFHEGREPSEGVEGVAGDLADLDLDPEAFLQGGDELDDGEGVELGEVAVQSGLRPEVAGLVPDVQRGYDDGLDVTEDRRRGLWRAGHVGSPGRLCGPGGLRSAPAALS